MPPRTKVEVVDGKMKGKVFDFDEHDTLVFGRARECHCCLPDDRLVSRHHFLLEVSPPLARLRDLGSLNGTYVNGKKCGGRKAGEDPEQGGKRGYPEVDLHHGDEVKVGDTVMRLTAEGEKRPRNVRSDELREEVARLLFDLDEKRNVEARKLIQQEIGNYTLQKEIGRGGFGAVYLGKRVRTGEVVAVKVMLSRAAVGKPMLAKFLREVESTAGLSHPNIVRVFDFGSSKGIFFLAMDYCNGGSVDQLMETHGGKLPLHICKPIMLHTLDGLQHAHGRGVVHRDVKPGNLLLSFSKTEVTGKVADFGLAKGFERAGFSGLTLTGASGGTPYFMPREQVLSFKYVKPTSDLWSAAATFYNMLTGQLPRDYGAGRDPLEIVLREPAVPILRRDAAIPPGIASVIDRALSDDVGGRYGSAKEMRQALDRAIAGG
jgi:serine/threonine protein kinase